MTLEAPAPAEGAVTDELACAMCGCDLEEGMDTIVPVNGDNYCDRCAVLVQLCLRPADVDPIATRDLHRRAHVNVVIALVAFVAAGLAVILLFPC